MLEQIIQNSVFSCYSGGWGQVPEGAAPEIGWEKIPVSRGECLLASVSLKLGAPIDLSGFRVSLQLPEDFSCVHVPQLAPLDNMVISEQVFRSPAMIWESRTEQLALIPNLRELEAPHPIPFIMDSDQRTRQMYYGVGNHEETRHVYHILNGKTTHMTGELKFSFYLLLLPKPESPRDFRGVSGFLWDTFGQGIAKAACDPASLTPYVHHVYEWAFDRWKDLCWQEFTLNGSQVGGVVFIVTAKQKKGLGQENAWREPKSIWNQAWFSCMRSAWGYAKWGERMGRPDWREKAEKALGFTLSAPQKEGLFPGYYAADEQNSLQNGHWVWSPPRRPEGHENYVHLLDSSWTCYWLLRWYLDIEPKAEILDYVENYLNALLSFQQPDGSFPAWVETDTREFSPYLRHSPETAAHIMLMLEWLKVRPNKQVQESALKAAEFLEADILSNGKWEDFETYWSCSGQWEEKQYGKRDRKTGLYSQCNFGMYWCAEAFLGLAQLTGEPKFLDAGERALAEISLYQQLIRPDFSLVETVGGFGVMNTDNEWNDARQSLFALTYLRYYRQTGRKEYLLRAQAAMKASFYMMYCPENPETKRCYELAHPFFDEQEYGFMMENYNHRDKRSKHGIGEFTIFDWGNGAACSSLAEFIPAYESLRTEETQ